MLVELRNIGLIRSIDLHLDGLTVVAGSNNLGKSYIGKTVFAMVKAMDERLDAPFIKNETTTVRDLTQQLFEFFLNQDPDYQQESQEWKAITRGAFSKTTLMEFLKRLMPSLEKNPKYPSSALLSRLKDLFYRIEHNYADDHFPNFQGLVQSIFQEDFKNKNTAENAFIHIASLFGAEIDSNNKVKFVGHNDKMIVDNAVLIETPVVLDLASFLINHVAFSDLKLPFHWYDLIKKLRIPATNNLGMADIFAELIEQTIQGSVHYSESSDNFIYTDTNQKHFPITNVASGIKSFGLLQVLMRNGHIAPGTLLILDEPEVNLHPEWQLAYAKLLVQLVQLGIKVLLTSHSPYFVEALKTYSDKEKIADRTHFYIGEPGAEGTIFKNVTNEIDQLFETFSFPMIKLMMER